MSMTIGSVQPSAAAGGNGVEVETWEQREQARMNAFSTAIRDVIGEHVDAVVAAQDFGIASAAKRGRNPKRPYVPVVKFHKEFDCGVATSQIMGLAYATRDEAVSRAQRQIESWRRKLATDLCLPQMRVLREHYGLPRDPIGEVFSS